MSAAPFDAVYAEAYDALYAAKPYATECDYVETLVRRHGLQDTTSILDVGCGTGSHARILAERGYRVTGVDRSAAMIEQAQRKSTSGHPIEWRVADARSLDLGRTFDAVLLMFAVLGYQTENEQVAQMLAAARRHLRPGGVLLFDVWYGATVLRQGPSDRTKVARYGGRTAIRAGTSRLIAERDIVEVTMNTWLLDGDRLVAHAEELHMVRYFFPVGLAAFLASAGLEPAAFTAFPEPDAPPHTGSWDLGCVAIAR